MPDDCRRRSIIAALICLAAAAATGWAAHLGLAAGPDRAILLGLREAGAPGLPVGPAWGPAAARAASLPGSLAAIIVIVAAASLYLRAQGMRRLAAQLCAGAAIAVVFAVSVKLLTGRARPDIVPALGGYAGSSFPSSHALLSMAVFTMVALSLSKVWGRQAALLAVAASAAILIGATRLYLGVHWPTDVLAGWLCGAALGFSYAAALARDHAPPRSGR